MSFFLSLLLKLSLSLSHKLSLSLSLKLSLSLSISLKLSLSLSLKLSLSLSKTTQATIETVYKELTLDESDHSMPDSIQERVRLIMLGETGLIADLRVNNKRSTGKYDQFFDCLQMTGDTMMHNYQNGCH